MREKRGTTVTEGTESKRKTRRVVEVVGPAGAGKTTLCQALTRASGCLHPGSFPDVRRVANAPFFAWYGLRTIPSVLRLCARGGRQLTRREFAWLSILNGWPVVLQKEWGTSNEVVVLDQGPVYLLTEIREFGPEYLRGHRAEKTWQALYGKWARMLDTIVWLNAPDTLLLERIRTRDKEHIVKSESNQAVFEFLVCYRNAYDRTISSLSAKNPGLKILRFDTSRKSPEEISSRLLSEFGLI